MPELSCSCVTVDVLVNRHTSPISSVLSPSPVTSGWRAGVPRPATSETFVSATLPVLNTW